MLDAASVVRHADKCGAAVAYFHGDTVSACVNRVFAKLLYNGGRSVNYLSCGNEVGNVKAENVYLSHGDSFLFSNYSSSFFHWKIRFIASMGVRVFMSVFLMLSQMLSRAISSKLMVMDSKGSSAALGL